MRSLLYFLWFIHSYWLKMSQASKSEWLTVSAALYPRHGRLQNLWTCLRLISFPSTPAPIRKQQSFCFNFPFEYKPKSTEILFLWFPPQTQHWQNKKQNWENPNCGSDQDGDQEVHQLSLTFILHNIWRWSRVVYTSAFSLHQTHVLALVPIGQRYRMLSS